MKIIGQTTANRFLVDASEDEMARLTGYQGNWYREHAGKARIKVGDEVDVTTLFSHSEKMKSIEEDLRRAKAVVDGCSAGLVMADNLIKAAIKEPESKEATSGE